MSRRDFVVAAALAAVPDPSPSQAAGTIYRLAIVDPTTPVERISSASRFYGPLLDELRNSGYLEGDNLSVARFSGQGKADRYEYLANVARAQNPDTVFSNLQDAIEAIRRTMPTTPIVAILSEPVAQGIVASLARPGGNVTGVTSVVGTLVGTKRLALLRELAPDAVRVAWVVTRKTWSNPVFSGVSERRRLSSA